MRRARGTGRGPRARSRMVDVSAGSSRAVSGVRCRVAGGAAPWRAIRTSDGGRPTRYAASLSVARDRRHRTSYPTRPGPALRSGDRIRLIDARRLGSVGIDEAADAGGDHPWLEHRDPRWQRGQRRAPVDSAQPRRRPGGRAMGEQRLPADARLAHPGRRVPGRYLRRPSGVRARSRRVRRDVTAVRHRAVDRDAHRFPGPAGGARARC